MSGHGHWSLAAEVVDDPTQAIQFDWACRIQRPADRLASTYLCRPDLLLDREALTAQSAAWFIPDCLPVHAGRRLILSVTRGRLSWRGEAGGIQIVPESALSSLMTHRWSYRFSFE